MTGHDNACRRSLRESWIILAAFAAVTVWVLAVCGVWGYREDRAIRADREYAGRHESVYASDDNGNIRKLARGELFERETRIYLVPGLAKSREVLVPAGYYSNVSSYPETKIVRKGTVLAAPIKDGPAHLATILGIPAWAFWGIMLPWVVSTVLTVWFALYGMSDEEMAENAPDPNLAERTPAFPVKPAEAGHA